MVRASFLPIVIAAALAAEEDSPMYYCNNALGWADWPRRGDNPEATLKRVAIFGRHGARVPYDADHARKCWTGDSINFTCPTRTFLGYANSPSGGTSPGFKRIRGRHAAIPGDNCLTGQLVDTGIQMLLNNGEQAARLYKDELGLDDIPQDQHVMIRSTEVTRVIQSAIAFTIGMFPALNSSWPSLNMIIPDENVDPMTPKNSVCPQLEDVLNEFYASAEGKKAVSRTKAQREYIGYITGRSDDFSTEDPDDMGDLYGGLNDCLTTHFCPTVPSDDKSVPRGLEPGGTIYADVLSNVTFWWNGKYHTSKELMKRAYGPIIDDFLDDLRVPGRRFSLYMGHDTGPANSIMDSLDLTWIDSGNRCTRNLPPFGSVLVMESYSDRQVRWVFNGRVASMDAIEECKAKPTCSFDLMWKYFADLVPNTYECEPLPRHRSRLRRS